MCRRSIAGIVLFTSLFCVECLATNVGYLPGDCCFLSALSRDLLDELDATDTPSFRYRLPDSFEGAFCGYKGYWRLDYEAMTKQQKAALRRVYDEVRSDTPRRLQEKTDKATGKISLVETNPLRVLIVNRDYEFRRYGVVGKYNEYWMTESDGGRYVPIVRDADVIMEEWSLSGKVDPLRVNAMEELNTTRGGRPSSAPLKSHARLKFIVLEGVWEDYINPEEGTRLFVVDEDLQEYRYSRADRWMTLEAYTEKQEHDEREALELDRPTVPTVNNW